MNTRLHKPIKAVFFLDHSRVLAPLLAAWVEAGHDIAACVTVRARAASRKWRRDRWLGVIAPTWSISTQLRKLAPRAPILEVTVPDDWQALATTLRALEPDILVSAFFPKLIPDSILSTFSLGGVNFHPALLPHFRGPQPIQHLVLTGKHTLHGGVTLHQMTNEFDRGAVIAQAPLQEPFWQSNHALDTGLAGAIAKLAAHAVPAYCRSAIAAAPQPDGDFAWAGIDVDTRVTPSWTLSKLERALALLNRRSGVYIVVESRHIRLWPSISVLGPPSGIPPRQRAGGVEFDVADARVVCAQSSRLKRRLAEIRTILMLRQGTPADVPIVYAATNQEDA